MAHGHQHGDHATGAMNDPAPNDPEHDIDAKSTTIWFIGGAIALFVGLWLLVVVFMRVVDAEREGKVDKAKNTELLDVQSAEKEFLDGANPTKKKLEAVLASLRRK
jgi:beta-lactamase regulating signal transducer with metallopeptidase domain